MRAFFARTSEAARKATAEAASGAGAAVDASATKLRDVRLEATLDDDGGGDDDAPSPGCAGGGGRPGGRAPPRAARPWCRSRIFTLPADASVEGGATGGAAGAGARRFAYMAIVFAYARTAAQLDFAAASATRRSKSGGPATRAT